MATVYVSAVDGNNANSGANWANAKQTIEGALSIATDATNTIFVDSAGTFTAGASTAITWNAPTADSFVAIISVNRAGGDAWLAGAKEVSGSAAAFNIATSGNQYLFIYGITIATDSGGSSANDINLLTVTSARATVEMRSCTMQMNGTSGGANLILGPAQGATVFANTWLFINSTLALPNSTSSAPTVMRQCALFWAGSSISFLGGSKPTALFISSSGGSSARIGDWRFIDCDLSGYDNASGNYFTATDLYLPIILINCKLSSNTGLVTGTWPDGNGSLTLINTDSADTRNVFEFRNRYGTITEDTSIYAASGAQFDGTSISWKIVTTSNCTEYTPFVCPWIHKWHGATSAITSDLEFVHDSATDLTDRNCWAEFEYVSSASFPQGTLLEQRNANPFTGSAVDLTNTSTSWTGTGGFANENKQRVRGSFTPAEKSLHRARLIVGIASKTLYLDPIIRT